MLFRERRELRQRVERDQAERVELHVDGVEQPMSVRATVMRELGAALMPAMVQHGSVSLTLGEPRPVPPDRPKRLVPGSARRGAQKRLGRVVSLRLDSDMYGEILRFATEEDVSPSEWMRCALSALIHERQQPPEVPEQRAVGWKCEHMTMTGPAGALGNVTAWCGCEMQPVYAAA